METMLLHARMAEPPVSLSAICIFAALSIGMGFGILIICVLIAGKRGNHGS